MCDTCIFVQKYKQNTDLYACQAGELSHSAPQLSWGRERGARLQMTSLVGEAEPNAAEERAPPNSWSLQDIQTAMC